MHKTDRTARLVKAYCSAGQHSPAKEKYMAIKIITDSTCDIAIKDCERMGVSLVPLRVTIDDVTYLDKFELSCNDSENENALKAYETNISELLGGRNF